MSKDKTKSSEEAILPTKCKAQDHNNSSLKAPKIVPQDKIEDNKETKQIRRARATIWELPFRNLKPTTKNLRLMPRKMKMVSTRRRMKTMVREMLKWIEKGRGILIEEEDNDEDDDDDSSDGKDDESDAESDLFDDPLVEVDSDDLVRGESEISF
ncbi:hypothetical protein SLE2022_057260 [Rubroshorea leprosula]